MSALFEDYTELAFVPCQNYSILQMIILLGN